MQRHSEGHGVRIDLTITLTLTLTLTRTRTLTIGSWGQDQRGGWGDVARFQARSIVIQGAPHGRSKVLIGLVQMEVCQTRYAGLACRTRVKVWIPMGLISCEHHRVIAIPVT